MGALFHKVRTIVMGDANALADKVIDLNSVAAVKQNVRDLEEGLEQIQDAAAIESGHVTTVTREIAALQAKVEELNKELDLILGDGNNDNDHLATPMTVRLNTMRQQLDNKQHELESAQAHAQQLNEAATSLRGKHEEMVSRVHELEAMDRQTKGEEHAAQALQAAGSLLGNLADGSVDDVAAEMQRRNDVADARFQRAMGGLSTGVEHDVALAQAAADIAARKARLAAQSAAASQPTDPAGSAT